MNAQHPLPGLEHGGHRCGRLCDADQHVQMVWLRRQAPRTLAAQVRVQYLAAGLNLTTNAPAPRQVFSSQPPIRHAKGSIAWLVGWPR